MPPPLIEFHDVTVQPGRQGGARRRDAVDRGREHVAILGPNGSGKSTLIKAITRECYPRHSANGAGLRILGRTAGIFLSCG